MTRKSHSGLVSRLRAECLGFLAHLILRLANATLRWQFAGFDCAHWPEGEPRILMFWHGRQLFMPWIYLHFRRRGRAKPIYALISESSDGRLIATSMKYLGIRSVAGSSSRGGRQAAQTLLRKLKEDSHIAITPDGPRGPCCTIKEGVLLIARRSGAPVYPCAVGAERYWQAKSWDKMIFPKPFSRTVCVIGAPIYLQQTSGSQREQLELLERALNETTEFADNYFRNERP